MSNIFEKRETPRPYEYPDLLKFSDAMYSSFWTIHEFEKRIEKDVKDFKVNLSTNERRVVKRCMLAIANVENKVKTFWGHLYDRMPKSEISIVGASFSNNEAIHFLCYSELLDKLKLSKEFSRIDEYPCMDGRNKYLSKYLEGVRSRSNKEFTKSLVLFTLLTENVSLFSQFAIMGSFRKYKNELRTFGNIVDASSRDEQLHSQFGSQIINIIRHENPEWFDQEMEDKIRRAIRKAYKAELEVLDWIFQYGELDFLSRASVGEYLKSRFNMSLKMIGYEPEYEIDNELYKKCKFMDINSKTSFEMDFFCDKGVSYNIGKDFGGIFE